MNTMPRTGRSASRRTERTCPTISCAARLREKPSRPVAQNAQASAQPAWLETQTMYFFSLPAYALKSAPGASQGMGMRTASTCAPPSSSNRYFTKPSAAACRRRTRTGSALVADSIDSSNARRTPRTDRRSGSPRWTAAASSLRPTSSVAPSGTYCSGSIPQRCITRRVLPAPSLEVDGHLHAVGSDLAANGLDGRTLRLNQEQVDVAVRLEEARPRSQRRGDLTGAGGVERPDADESPPGAVPQVGLRRAERARCRAGHVDRDLHPGGCVDRRQAQGRLHQNARSPLAGREPHLVRRRSCDQPAEQIGVPAVPGHERPGSRARRQRGPGVEPRLAPGIGREVVLPEIV